MNPLASEFFAAMQDLLLAGDPHPRASEPAAPAPTVVGRKPADCRWCGGTQERGEGGGGCSWCEPTDEPDDGDDITLEQACRNMGIEP